MTRREAEELQALAQIALPAVRTYRQLRTVLPCEADRYRLRAAMERVVRAGAVSGRSHDDRCRAAVHYLARGGDPLPC